jgi:HAMP domain-containing protein
MNNPRHTLNLKEIEKRCQNMASIAQEREEAEIIQFPLWPEVRRGTPNSFIRSALFAAIHSKDRDYLEEAVLASQKGVTVKFTGKQLNQEDLDVWEALVHLARKHPLGYECSFTAYGILKALGLPTGGTQHKKLHSAIIRLAACAVQISHEGKTYFGSLVESGIKDEITSHYVIRLNRRLIRLFGDTQWTAIDWQQRLQLRRKPLAQAIHAYYSSHERPLPVKLTTLQELTGSRNTQRAGFKRHCRTALDALVSIGFLRSYKIEGDLVAVERAHKALPKNQ